MWECKKLTSKYIGFVLPWEEGEKINLEMSIFFLRERKKTDHHSRSFIYHNPD